MTTTRLRERVTAIVIELPEATATGSPHRTFAVRHKTFLDDHPATPACLDTRDRVGLRLDRVRAEPPTEAYRLPAPHTPAALHERQAGSSSPR